MSVLKLTAELESWPLIEPFRIAGYTFEAIDVVKVRLDQEGNAGHGEAAGVYYKDDRPASMLRQIEKCRSRIEHGLTRDTLLQLLPPGGARNALDCALWDLEAKCSGRDVAELAGLDKPKALLTTMTCGADSPDKMAVAAKNFSEAKAIKLKLTGEPCDEDRVLAVREARNDVWLSVDANQAFTLRVLETLVKTRVALIEQPFRVGQEALLDRIESPIAFAADESVQCLSDVTNAASRFQFLNIKLDKCGGLTEGLAMARKAHDLGLDTMVGNMMGTSLAMAPAYLLGQICKIVELDGPLYLTADREPRVVFRDGLIRCSDAVWGASDCRKFTADNI